MFLDKGSNKRGTRVYLTYIYILGKNKPVEIRIGQLWIVLACIILYLKLSKYNLYLN